MVDTEEVDFNLYHPDKAIRKTLRFTAVVTWRIFETKYCDEHLFSSHCRWKAACCN